MTSLFNKTVIAALALAAIIFAGFSITGTDAQAGGWKHYKGHYGYSYNHSYKGYKYGYKKYHYGKKFKFKKRFKKGGFKIKFRR